MHAHLNGYAKGGQPIGNVSLTAAQKASIKAAIKRLEKINPDQFELYFQRKTATRIDSKDQKVDALSRAEDVGLAVRLVKDQRLGFSYTTSLEREAVERAIQSATEIAALMPEDPYAQLASFGSYVYPAVDSFDHQGLKVPTARKIELARELEHLCRSSDARIRGIRQASISETNYEVLMIDSHGEQIQHQSTTYSASVSCKAEQDGDSQMGGDYTFSNYLDNLDIASTARQAAGFATELLGAGGAPTLVCPAILRNSVVASLIDFLSHSFSAEEIAKGRSMLAGKLGQHVFSDRVNLIDDGLLPGGLATSPFDGEGVPSRHTTLVSGGFVQGLLYDTYYARKSEAEPTGNASRGLKSPPSIGTSNLYMPAGRRTPENLRDGIDRGILITQLMGVHTANSVTGDFSLGASGIMIENGKLTRPVRGFAVAGNVLELFRRMTDLGNDLRFFGSVGAPSARVSQLSIGGQ